MSFVACFVMAGSDQEARRLGDALVEQKLAACANILGPVASTYWWQGRMERASEVLLILKTREDLVAQLTAYVRAHHTYEVPEVVALPILGGNTGYLEWIDASVRPRGRRTQKR